MLLFNASPVQCFPSAQQSIKLILWIKKKKKKKGDYVEHLRFQFIVVGM